MALESATFISQLSITDPVSSDSRTTADDHLRLIKICLKNSFNDIGSEVSASAGEFNFLRGVTANLQTQLSTVNGLYNDLTGGTATVGNTLQWEGATKYVSTATAAGGSDGDVWFRYEE